MSMCRMDGGDGLGHGISEFMSAMGWSTFEGQPMNEIPMQLSNVVHLDGNTSQQVQEVIQVLVHLGKQEKGFVFKGRIQISVHLKTCCL
jgi:hypothetical protein